MKKIIGIFLSLLLITALTACEQKPADSTETEENKETENSLDLSKKKEMERQKAKELEEKELEKKRQQALMEKTFYCSINAMLYDSPDFNSETAVEAPHKGQVIIKSKIYADVVDETENKDSGNAELNTEESEEKTQETNEENSDESVEKTDSENEQKTTRKVIAYQLESIDGKPSDKYMKAEHLYSNLYDFIEYPVEGVSYEPFEKKIYENNPPIKVRGVYVSLNAAANGGGLLDYLINLAKTTDINTFVIDVKDDSGYLLFPSEAGAKYMPEQNNAAIIKDIKGLVKKLKDENIYLVARIVAFKGSLYAEKHPAEALQYKNGGALYSDSDEIYWSTPFNRKLWDYNISLAEECADLGFNEIQFDYVRFPATTESTDAELDFHNELNESKSLAVHNFLKEAYKRLSAKEVYVTADLFGWMATATDDQNIGQHWESLVNVVDYVAPMIYPSHYGYNNFGLEVPDAHPYECVDASIKDAISRNNNLYTPAKLRPWIQDFTAPWISGYIEYGPNEIKAQIKALKDNGIDEYMLWNAANRYSDGGLHGDKE